MEQNQPTDSFDAMLKQSLESANMPVPSGVWESVGSSIASKAIVASKVAGIKLIIIKTLAGIVLTGAGVYGIYELLSSPNPSKEIQKESSEFPKIITDENIDNVEVIEENNNTIHSDCQLAPIDNSITKPIYSNSDSIRERIALVEQNNYITPKAEDGYSKKNTPTIIETATKTEPQIANKNDEKSEIIETSFPNESQSNLQPISIEPSNVFTPDGDGLNDYFKIEVENEKVFVIQIFDESGKKVFESLDKNKSWDGKNMYTGQTCKKGYYYYKLIIEFSNGYKKIDSRGISLL